MKQTNNYLLFLSMALVLYQSIAFASEASDSHSPLHVAAEHGYITWQGLGSSGTVDDGVPWTRDAIGFSVESVIVTEKHDAIEAIWAHGQAPFGTMVSDGYLWQGEVEDWFVNVQYVPDPNVLFLFGAGCLGLAGVYTRKQS